MEDMAVKENVASIKSNHRAFWSCPHLLFIVMKESIAAPEALSASVRRSECLPEMFTKVASITRKRFASARIGVVVAKQVAMLTRT